jgi:hypothetical protein
VRIPESVAVSDTSLAALLKVALSLPSPLAPAALVALPAWVADGAGGVTPNRDFNPSKLFRMSMRITPYRFYRRAF